MFGTLERLIAFRYLRARRQEGFISVIAIFSLTGIALGVATLIVTMAVMNGFRAELLGRILGFNGHINVYAAQGPLTNYDDLAATIRKLQGITSATPMIQGQVMSTAGNQSSGALVRGMSLDDLKRQALIADNLSPGALDNFKDNNVIIGYRLAQTLGIRPGGSITLISPQGSATVFGTVPRIKTYTVAGTFNVSMYEFDSAFIFMPLDTAQTYFNVDNAVTTIEVKVANPDRVKAYDLELFQALGGKVKLSDWEQSNLSFFNAVEVERNVMFLILTLIILVAAFNIISSMIMMVKDKGRDIAILRTMGATRGTILRIFILAGASVGFVGTFIGFVIGVEFATHIEAIRRFIQAIIGTDLFSAEIYFLTQIPARVDPYEVGTVVAMAFGLSFLATIYPAWRAAQLDPVEALRYE
ncbi:MAG TPA: lipoprotein-releasing ABC transporter permease subunit [Stellaceae bacterium]|jgi:lipoprotein-releasing system permease protein|nr:lipoprotein-releasing ABC transporter permease subunit [Stellaceae bacterium]